MGGRSEVLLPHLFFISFQVIFKYYLAVLLSVLLEKSQFFIHIRYIFLVLVEVSRNNKTWWQENKWFTKWDSGDSAFWKHFHCKEVHYSSFSLNGIIIWLELATELAPVWITFQLFCFSGVSVCRLGSVWALNVWSMCFSSYPVPSSAV